jgi:hypothetical protein
LIVRPSLDVAALGEAVFLCPPARVPLLIERGVVIKESPAESPETPLAAEGLQRLIAMCPALAGMAASGAWRSAGAAGLPEEGAYLRALNAYVDAFAPQRSQEARAARLRLGLRLTQEAVAAAARLPRLFTLARIAGDLGETGTATAALTRIGEVLTGGGSFAFDEPFLPPDPAFDGAFPAERLSDWVVAGVFQTRERLSPPGGEEPHAALHRLTTLATRSFHDEILARRLENLRRRLDRTGGERGLPRGRRADGVTVEDWS